MEKVIRGTWRKDNKHLVLLEWRISRMSAINNQMIVRGQTTKRGSKETTTPYRRKLIAVRETTKAKEKVG